VNDFNFWFSTKYLDQETGFYYYGLRYHNPELGRWINRDPAEETLGLAQYGFVESAPIIKYDVLGLWSSLGLSFRTLCDDIIGMIDDGNGRGKSKLGDGRGC